MKNIFIECFSEVKDPRMERTKKHLLLDIIALTLFAVMSGAQTFDEIELFGTLHEEWLKKYLVLPNGIPSHDTINRTLSLLDSEQLQKGFIDWIGQVKGYVNENVIAIDGKTIKGSHQIGKGLKALHVLNAYSCANGLSLGQLKVDGKTNEITAIPQLIDQLAIEGAIITIDAMGCQKNITQAIVDRDAEYVLAVKGNHKDLYKPIIDKFWASNHKDCSKSLKPECYNHEIEGSHGRIENRKVEALPVSLIANQSDLSEWKDIHSIIKVEYTNHTTKIVENRYYISSLPHNQVEKIAHSIRNHWQIENNLHWALDVSFREDSSRIRDENAALNFSWFRKMGLALLNKDGTKMSVRKKMFRNSIKPENILIGIL